MLVAFWLQDFGNSTSSWRKEPTAAVRDSHSAVSYGGTPGRVNSRRTLRASAARAGCVSVVCGVVCSILRRLPSGADPRHGPQICGRLTIHLVSDGTVVRPGWWERLRRAVEFPANARGGWAESVP